LFLKGQNMATKKVKRAETVAKCVAKMGPALATAAVAIEPLSGNERICVLAALVELFDAGYLDRGNRR